MLYIKIREKYPYDCDDYVSSFAHHLYVIRHLYVIHAKFAVEGV